MPTFICLGSHVSSAIPGTRYVGHAKDHLAGLGFRGLLRLFRASLLLLLLLLPGGKLLRRLRPLRLLLRLTLHVNNNAIGMETKPAGSQRTGRVTRYVRAL